tara:strand:+ start:2103 stop:2594 length:492 start_codon:yes stop_codon:yes gene_type:complete
LFPGAADWHPLKKNSFFLSFPVDSVCNDCYVYKYRRRANAMTKVHHTVYKKNYREYILDHIDQDHDGNQLSSDKEKIKFLFDRFNSEYGWNIQRVGKRKAMIEWLSGVAISFAIYNNEIIDLAIRMGSIDENPDDRLVDRVLDNYFPFMANIILGMESELEVK